VSSLTIGIDIGGSKLAAGLVDSDGTVVTRMRHGTPSTDPQATEEVVIAVVRDLSRGRDVQAVGVGAAGFIDASRSVVLFSPHLAWRNEPLRSALEERVGLPVVVENDANAAAWAEWRFGAAVAEPVVLCVNLGTGIGGAIVVNGQLWRGGWGMAGEFGHMTVQPEGHRCECGNRGCWEQYASGNALVREARELAAANSPVAHAWLEQVEGDSSAITGSVLMQAAKGGDPAAIELFEDIGQWLGHGLAGLAAAFDPTVFVIGGGVSEAGELLLEPARRSFSRNLTGRGYRPEAAIVAAQLGNDAGFIGAADLARQDRPGAAVVSPGRSR
jgi:glucokinase